MWLVPGERMLFADGAKGIAFDADAKTLKVVPGDSDEVLVHDPRNRAIALLLAEMPGDIFPVALGVLYEDPAPTFESVVVEQNLSASEGKERDLQALLSAGQTWQVTKEPHEE